MDSNNLVSLTLTDAQVADWSKNLSLLQAALKPNLVALSPKQKKALPKMGDGSYAFVQKVDDYMTSNPEYTPPFVDAEEMHKDVDVVRLLTPMLQTLTALQSDLEDTITIAASEAFSAARTYYNSVSYAADKGKLSAKPIAAELAQRYPGRVKTTEKAQKTDNSQQK